MQLSSEKPMEVLEESSGAEFALLTPRDSPDEPLGFQMVQSAPEYGEYVPCEEYYGDVAGAVLSGGSEREAACRLHAGPVQSRRRRRRVLGRRLELGLEPRM